MNMITQVEFNAEGDILRGEMYFPTDSYEEKLPTIVMFHGFAALKEMYTDDIAKQFAKNGYVVFLFDNRNFGESDGQPRQEINPWQQIEDYRHVITYATTYDFVGEERIGIWGTSLSGGHTLVVSAIDRRVKCVVSVVPTISGYENGLRRGSPDSRDKLQKYLMKDRKKRLMGESPSTMPVVPEKEESNNVFSDGGAPEWYSKAGKRADKWLNYVTVRSIDNVRSYEPGGYISNIEVPLLMIVAKEDVITPSDLALKAYKKAIEPKKLVMIDGGHFEPYIEGFKESSEAAINWFNTHL